MLSPPKYSPQIGELGSKTVLSSPLQSPRTADNLCKRPELSGTVSVSLPQKYN